jgi:hypothetical protein
MARFTLNSIGEYRPSGLLNRIGSIKGVCLLHMNLGWPEWLGEAA